MTYKYYKDSKNNIIYAVSSYAGKIVKGKAACSPNDSFDEETGKHLARLRCDIKIATKRLKRAKEKYNEAVNASIAAKRHVCAMNLYLNDAEMQLNDYINELNALMERISLFKNFLI